MPGPPRADEALGIYHALNRGNLRASIIQKEADFAAFDGGGDLCGDGCKDPNPCRSFFPLGRLRDFQIGRNV